MLSKTPVELMEECIRMAQSKDWTERQVRPMHLGDRFVLGDDDWALVLAKDIPTFKAAGMTTHKLKAWPDSAIVQLSRTI